ncbi:MAG: SMI1/KNR4 family protein [Verrucomicrobia bacterium]|nr:SMI1/KNR4 family protein [Verrucomicrobiota bacterium]
MNKNVARYFQTGLEQTGAFYEVIALHEHPEIDWSEATSLCPLLPRGWYELAQLAPAMRLEFVRGYWASVLPFRPHINAGIDTFFATCDEIGIFLTRRLATDPLLPHLVYELANDKGFFQGFIPASDDQIASLERWMGEFRVPTDYLAFLRIHNGFAKVSDTGLIPCQDLPKETKIFRDKLLQGPPLLWANGEGVHIDHLFPFYQSFGMEFYQCFCADWYPEQEMGTLYYSGDAHTISDYRHRGDVIDNLAFPTFLDWLVFYLETVVTE